MNSVNEHTEVHSRRYMQDQVIRSRGYRAGDRIILKNSSAFRITDLIQTYY